MRDGSGSNPALKRIRRRRSAARDCHSSFVAIFGNDQGESVVRTFWASVCEAINSHRRQGQKRLPSHHPSHPVAPTV